MTEYIIYYSDYQLWNYGNDESYEFTINDHIKDINKLDKKNCSETLYNLLIKAEDNFVYNSEDDGIYIYIYQNNNIEFIYNYKNYNRYGLKKLIGGMDYLFKILTINKIKIKNKNLKNIFTNELEIINNYINNHKIMEYDDNYNILYSDDNDIQKINENINKMKNIYESCNENIKLFNKRISYKNYLLIEKDLYILNSLMYNNETIQNYNYTKYLNLTNKLGRELTNDDFNFFKTSNIITYINDDCNNKIYKINNVIEFYLKNKLNINKKISDKNAFNVGRDIYKLVSSILPSNFDKTFGIKTRVNIENKYIYIVKYSEDILLYLYLAIEIFFTNKEYKIKAKQLY